LVAKQLTCHLVAHGMYDATQSAYRKHHSTETDLLKVQNDILCAVDKGSAVILVLLDLSAAFDTLDHGILINRLEHWFGVKHDALRWIESYLTDRSQRVILGDYLSKARHIKHGIPQGSVLGPVLFTCYLLPLVKIVQHHAIKKYTYADDNQLYVAFELREAADMEKAIYRLEACIHDIRGWMTTNWLKLNNDKTEMLVIGIKNMVRTMYQLMPNISILIGDQRCKPFTSVRNLGIYPR
jgi:hypothetical protein